MKKRWIALSLLVCLLLSFTGCGANGRAYRQADKLFDEAQYAEAAEIFQSLDDYKDAAERASECKYRLAKTYIQAEDPNLAEAVRLLLDAGEYGDAKTLLESVQNASCYAEAGRRIPTLGSVIPDASCAEETGTDENGPYHSYVYTWNDPDANALSKRFTAWLDELNGAADIDAEPYLNGTYYILIGGERVGLASSSRADKKVEICVKLYTDVIS